MGPKFNCLPGSAWADELLACPELMADASEAKNRPELCVLGILSQLGLLGVPDRASAGAVPRAIACSCCPGLPATASQQSFSDAASLQMAGLGKHKARPPAFYTKAECMQCAVKCYLRSSLPLSAVLGRLVDGASAKRCCASTPVSRPLRTRSRLRYRPSRPLPVRSDSNHHADSSRYGTSGRGQVQQHGVRSDLLCASPVHSFILRVACRQDACYRLQLCEKPLKACIGIADPGRIQTALNGYACMLLHRDHKHLRIRSASWV